MRENIYLLPHMLSLYGPKLNGSNDAVVSIIVILGKKIPTRIAQNFLFQEITLNPKILAECPLSQSDVSNPKTLSEKLGQAKGLCSFPTHSTLVMALLEPPAFQHCHGSAEVKGTLLVCRLRKSYGKAKQLLSAIILVSLSCWYTSV